jgi:phage terminase large subunit-like protein
MTGAEKYSRWVLDPVNEKKTGRLIKLAAKRFLSDLQRTDVYFDEVEAVKMVNFGERYCYQWEGDFEGVPVTFQDWQRFIFEQVYGWFYTETKLRRFEEVYVQIAKKNGKSTMSAVLMNYHLFADERVKTPKVFTGANNEDQAKICVNMAGRIVQFSPDLNDFVEEGKVKLSTYGINITEVIHKEKNGFIKAFAKESGDKKSKTAGGKHGVNASLGVIDEFGMSPDHGASKPIKTSMISRKERLMFYITTAGFNLEGPCYTELRKVGIQVLEGSVIKDNYLPLIFEIDKPADEDGKPMPITVEWLLQNEWSWDQSNPNIDVSVQRKNLKSDLGDALTYGGTTEVDTLTLNFNIWMNSPEVFIPADVWNRNYHGTDPDILDGKECFAGIEVGPSGEISAIAFLFPGEIVKFKMVYIIAEESIKLNETYLKNRDSLMIDPGNEVDNDIAIKWISDIFSKYKLHSFCFPVTHKNNSIIQGLIKLGYEGNPISQGLSGIADATMEWEKLLRAGQVEHFNDEILRVMNSNCLAIRKEAGTRVEKSSRVLGIYACLDAIAQWKTIEAERKPSVYSYRGVITLD